MSGRWGAGALLGLAALLPGCFTAERNEQARAIDRARAALGPSFDADAPAERVLRGNAGDRELEAELARGPTLVLVKEAAVRRNPGVQAALERWVAFLERVPQKTALPNPTFRYTYANMFKMNEFDVMQEVPFPTKLATEGRAALAEARAAEAELAERSNMLRAQAASSYAALHFARREQAIIDENLALLDRFVESVGAKYAANKASQSDVLRVEGERDMLRAERATAAREVEIEASALNVLMDRAPEAPLGPLGALPAPATPTAAAPLLERALDERPELKAALERMGAADASLSRAHQEWIPDFTIGGGDMHDYSSGGDFADLTAGISIPLSWGRIRGREAEAEADARRARAEARSTRNRVLDEVKKATARVAAAAERYRILDDAAVPRAQQNVTVSEAAYAASQIDSLTLIDTERALLTRQLERERALADHAMRLAELEKAVGAREK